MGRPTIFGPKDPKKRYQGVMTREGSKEFEVARGRLAKLADMPVRSVSDGDVFEYLSRGEDDTKRYLASRT